MKNIDSPSPDKFVLTHKKKRMIKAMMLEFKRSKEYDKFNFKGEFVPTTIEFGNFLKDRLRFLKNINFTVMVETIKGIWTGLVFQYAIEMIIVETNARESFFKELS